MTSNSASRSPRHVLTLVAASAMLAGCAGAPPAGTPEYTAWLKQKQAEAVSIQEEGGLHGANWFRQHQP